MFALRSFQKKALESLQNPAHVICVAPTGSGKSLIYEKFAAQSGVRTLLVTPLVALGRQQANHFKAANLKVSLGIGNSFSEDPTAIPQADTDVWIVSPELIQTPSKIKILKKWRPNFLVVDECHCLWEWGEDFRPAFAPLPKLIQKYKIPRSLWLTATLPREARSTLRTLLPTHNQVDIGSFEITEKIFLNVLRVPWIYRSEVMLNWMRQQFEPGVIFVATRDETLRVQNLLSSTNKKSVTYHAGMSREERLNLENQILKNKSDVIIATSAFGMGMHYAHLKWVLLWQPSLSLLSLSQQIGRVGRGEGNAHALIFWEEEDFRLLEWAIGDSRQKQDNMKQIRNFLETKKCRRQYLAEYFGVAGAQPCRFFCDICRVRGCEILNKWNQSDLSL